MEGVGLRLKKRDRRFIMKKNKYEHYNKVDMGWLWFQRIAVPLILLILATNYVLRAWWEIDLWKTTPMISPVFGILAGLVMFASMRELALRQAYKHVWNSLVQSGRPTVTLRNGKTIIVEDMVTYGESSNGAKIIRVKH